MKERPNELDNWKYSARNPVLFNAESVAPTAAEYVQQLKKQQKVINKQGTRIDVSTINWKEPTVKTNVFVVPRVDITGKLIEDQQKFDVLPTPDPNPAPEDSPFITWGQIDGTPFRLDGSDMTPVGDGLPSFKLPDQTKRELIAHDMVEKIKKNNQAKRAFSKNMTEKLR